MWPRAILLKALEGMASITVVFSCFIGRIFIFYFDIVDLEKLLMSFLGQVGDRQN